MNDLDRDLAYAEALGAAMTLPTWVLRRWERRASRKAVDSRLPHAELSRLLAVRSVLRQRGHR